jgi:hypothetical protein
MSKQDDADAAFYDNPENLHTRGPVQRRASHPRLSSHTPVRFDPDTVAAIRQFSDDDGVTVSAWVRHVVAREIRKRTSLQARTASSRANRGEIRLEQAAAGSTVTAASSLPVDGMRVAS